MDESCRGHEQRQQVQAECQIPAEDAEQDGDEVDRDLDSGPAPGFRSDAGQGWGQRPCRPFEGSMREQAGRQPEQPLAQGSVRQ
jgi:hypothetical protein